MYAIKYTRGLDPLVRQVRQAMIEFTILQAVNILAGRIIVGPGISKLQGALWAADQNPHRLQPNGQLNPGLDTRFKGVFLSPNATFEMKKLWERATREKRVTVSADSLGVDSSLTYKRKIRIEPSSLASSAG